jgi:hypothetical protein
LKLSGLALTPQERRFKFSKRTACRREVKFNACVARVCSYAESYGSEEEEAMSEKRYVVPEGMLEAAKDALYLIDPVRSERLLDVDCTEALEAALRWQSENWVVPTLQEMSDWVEGEGREICRHGHFAEIALGAIIEWQRRMYLAPEPKTPDRIDLVEIMDLMDRTFAARYGIDDPNLPGLGPSKPVAAAPRRPRPPCAMR